MVGAGEKNDRLGCQVRDFVERGGYGGDFGGRCRSYLALIQSGEACVLTDFFDDPRLVEFTGALAAEPYESFSYGACQSREGTKLKSRYLAKIIFLGQIVTSKDRMPIVHGHEMTAQVLSWVSFHPEPDIVVVFTDGEQVDRGNIHVRTKHDFDHAVVFADQRRDKSPIFGKRSSRTEEANVLPRSYHHVGENNFSVQADDAAGAHIQPRDDQKSEGHSSRANPNHDLLSHASLLGKGSM